MAGGERRFHLELADTSTGHKVIEDLVLNGAGEPLRFSGQRYTQMIGEIIFGMDHEIACEDLHFKRDGD